MNKNRMLSVSMESEIEVTDISGPLIRLPCLLFSRPFTDLVCDNNAGAEGIDYSSIKSGDISIMWDSKNE